MNPTNITQKLLFISLFALLFSGNITASATADPAPTTIYSFVLPNELRELVNTNRRIALPPPADNLAEMLNSFQTPNLTAETDEATAQRIIQSRERGGARPETLTHEQIKSELDFLFNVLRYGYGAYQYFGGDDVFLPLKQSMLAQLSQMSNPLSTNDYITNLLVPSLRNVIADNHFWIAGHLIGVRSQLYISEDFILRETENGFITEIDGQTYRILGITLDGQVVDGILPTLTADGEFAWAFGYVVYNLPPAGAIDPILDLTVSFQNIATNIISDDVVQLFSTPNASGLSTDTYSISYAEGVTVLSNRRLSNPVPPSFLETAVELRDELILILDLRGHSGGNSRYATQWIQRYTGESIGGSVFAGNQLRSATAHQLNRGIMAATPPQWNLWERGRIFEIQNENLVIVLTDNAIMSTGDAFVGMLRQLENVLFVGTNTMGCLVTGNVGGVLLPYSRANIGIGTQLNYLPDLLPFEGVGFAPDLWVAPNASLERVLMFANNLDYVSITITRADTDAAASEFIDSFIRSGVESVSLGDFESYEITNAQRIGNRIAYTVEATHIDGTATYTFRVDTDGIISAFSYVIRSTNLYTYKQIAIDFTEAFFRGDIAGAIALSWISEDGSEEETQASLQIAFNQITEMLGDFIDFTLTEMYNVPLGARIYFTTHHTNRDMNWVAIIDDMGRVVEINGV